MSQEENIVTLASFTGQWIGETQGYEMPAHLWEITQYGDYLSLRTRWEGENTWAHFSAQLVPGEPAFQIMSTDPKNAKATLVDKQHFVRCGLTSNNDSAVMLHHFAAYGSALVLSQRIFANVENISVKNALAADKMLLRIKCHERSPEPA